MKSSVDMLEEEVQVTYPMVGIKLSKIAPTFVPSCTMIISPLVARTLMVRMSAPNSKIGNKDILQDAHFFEESDEDKMLDIYFPNDAMDTEISPR